MDIAGIGGIDADIGVAGLVDHEVVIGVEYNAVSWIGHVAWRV